MEKDLVEFAEDKRKIDPDTPRQGAFKAGWTEAVKDDKQASKYRKNPKLEDLTWENLGYRLGCLFGETSDELRQEMFEWCKRQQKQVK